MSGTNWSRRKYTKQQFINAWNDSLSIAGCARNLGLTIYGSTYITLRRTARELGLTEDHMTGQGWNVGEQKRATILPKDISEYLTTDSSMMSNTLKKRLLREGLLENVCAICGLAGEWQGKPLSLQLDHINGINNDNRIENLRILCPNCHAQTDTFCRRKVKGS